MKKIALIGDLVASRKIANRAAFQASLLATLTRLSEDNPHILSPYTLTLGDEFQAVFDRGAGIFKDVMLILTTVYPQKVRFAIGVGDIDTAINPKQSIGMDGPAFHNARKELERLKAEECLFGVAGIDGHCGVLTRESLHLLSHNIDKWKENRFHILAMLNNGLSVKEIADSLQISDKAVYKDIDSGTLRTVIRMLAAVEAIIDDNLVNT
ncbi:MAG: SatD family protein [bacterium]|nr:SatD family protein [bacterium]